MVTFLATNPVNLRWQASMQTLIEAPVDPDTGFSPLLPEMSHMD
ncbi:MAG TPA: hypothetical protein VGD98_07515 [Ktedonobacteraceae bacterium]